MRRKHARRFLFAAACAAIVALPFAFPPPAARACPPDPPSPLRRLYLDSDLVAVVRVGDSAPVAADEEEGRKADDGQGEKSDKQPGEKSGGETVELIAPHAASMVKTSLAVAKSLKGDGRERTVSLYHYQSGGEADESYAKGAKLLVFLSTREGGGYTPTDYRYSIKRLAEDDLKVYVRRIEELSAIYARQARPGRDRRVARALRRGARDALGGRV